MTISGTRANMAEELDLTPEQALLYTVIMSAINENDREYFESDVFEYHCSLLNLEADDVRERAIKELNLLS